TLKRLGFGSLGVFNFRSIDGAGLRVAFTPRKRYATHRLVVTDPKGMYSAELDVPVWCVGSCLRDEDWQRWGAEVVWLTQVADRRLYNVRMHRLCNGGKGETMF